MLNFFKVALIIAQITGVASAQESQANARGKYDRFARKLVEHGIITDEKANWRTGNYSVRIGFSTYPPGNGTIVGCFFEYRAPFAHIKLLREHVSEEAEQSIFAAWLRDWADEKAREYSLELSESEDDKLSAAAAVAAKRVCREIDSFRKECEKNFENPQPFDRSEFAETRLRLIELQKQFDKLIDAESSLVGKQLESLRATSAENNP